MNSLKNLLIFFLGTSLLFSCVKPDETPKALVNVFLVDAPAEWDSVVVELVGVELDFVPNGREGQIEKIFLPYELADKQIDLSQLVGGAALPVGRQELVLGRITGATLRLGTSNFLYQGDKEYPLALPGGETDFSSTISIELNSGLSYDIIVDFDLEKSIKAATGSPPTFQFNPSLHIYSNVGRGQIQGTIAPASLSPAIYAISDGDSISTHVNSSNTYLFRLSPGTYSLYIDPKNSKYADTVLNVKVLEGEKTTLDRITLPLK